MAVTQQSISDNYTIQGDVRITKLNLYCNDKSKNINIKANFADITFYEDVFKSSLYGSISIDDSIGLLSGKVSGFPIIGEEWLELEYYVPGRDMISLWFRVFKPVNVNYDDKQSRMLYELDFCSEEHFTDANVLIQKSYNNLISDIVLDVVQRSLKSSKDIFVDPTMGPQSLIIPNITPYETIELLRRKAVSQAYPSNSYTFFENKRGLYFTTIEKLISDFSGQSSNPTYVYTYDPQIAGTNPIPMTTFKNFIHIQYGKTADTVQKLKTGFFGSNTLALSPLTQSWAQKQDKGIGNLSQYTSLNGKPPNTSGFIQAYQGSKYIFTVLDASLPDQHKDILEGPRSFFMTALAQRMLTGYAPGDTDIHAGDVITLNLSEAHGFTPKQDTLDPTRSGKYLVGSIKHGIDTKTYYMTMDLYQLDVPNSVG